MGVPDQTGPAALGEPHAETRVDELLPGGHYQVRGDQSRLEQVVINLLSNAHKYSHVPRGDSAGPCVFLHS